jgi:hypothetical protein
MSKSNTTENDLMKLIFQKTLPAYLGTLATTGNANLYLALHTDDPGEGGSQTTDEADYTDYARVEVVRSSAGWTITDNQAENKELVQFPLCGGGTNLVTYVSVGTEDSPAAGQILYSGLLNDGRTISAGIQPQFAAGDLIFEED